MKIECKRCHKDMVIKIGTISASGGKYNNLSGRVKTAYFWCAPCQEIYIDEDSQVRIADILEARAKDFMSRKE